jgi:hypothetical protein
VLSLGESWRDVFQSLNQQEPGSQTIDPAHIRTAKQTSAVAARKKLDIHFPCSLDATSFHINEMQAPCGTPCDEASEENLPESAVTGMKVAFRVVHFAQRGRVSFSRRVD